MKKAPYFIVIIGLFSFLQALSGCKKVQLLSKGDLAFSVDTVLFDTVFTTVGSVTKRFKIYNSSDHPVKIEKVTLKGGKSSPYRVNLDGAPGVQFKNITIPGKDSLFMFVEVTLDPNNINNPLIVEDKINFYTNGINQSVQLAAWGQDAYFHNNEYAAGVWKNDKPHVIYNQVVVPKNKTLVIPAGTRIYLHKGAMLVVDGGTLNINGTYSDKVIIQGDRLESFYKDVKGQYYGIYLDSARSSTINNAILKNGTVGVHVFGDNPANTTYTLTIKNTEIYQQARYGIFNFAGGRIKGVNLNIHDNKIYAYFVLEGGDCNFRHCQFLSYGSEGSKPAIAIKNYFTENDGITYIGSIQENSFYNSIIYGGGDVQIAFDTINKNGAAVINYDFQYNDIRQKKKISSPYFSNNLWNKNPKFESVENQEYKITSSSPCSNAGSSAFAIPSDIEGNSRNMANPDIGAYEIN